MTTDHYQHDWAIYVAVIATSAPGQLHACSRGDGRKINWKIFKLILRSDGPQISVPLSEAFVINVTLVELPIICWEGLHQHILNLQLYEKL